jgi:hypothetical protein
MFVEHSPTPHAGSVRNWKGRGGRIKVNVSRRDFFLRPFQTVRESRNDAGTSLRHATDHRTSVVIPRGEQAGAQTGREVAATARAMARRAAMAERRHAVATDRPPCPQTAPGSTP